jgi:transcriptional regulator with XRE-family HTH domain
MALQDRICEHVRAVMLHRGISQAALGKDLEVLTGEAWPQSRIWKLVHGRIPMRISVLDALGQILNLNLVELIAPKSASMVVTADERELLSNLRLHPELAPAVMVLLQRVVSSGPKRRRPRKRLT